MKNVIPGIVKGLGLLHFLLKRSLVHGVLSVFEELSNEAGQSLLKLDIVVEVVFVKPLKDGHVGVVGRLFKVLSPGEEIVQIDPDILPT